MDITLWGPSEDHFFFLNIEPYYTEILVLAPANTVWQELNKF